MRTKARYVILALLLQACTGDRRETGTADTPVLDTLLFRSELDSAKTLLRTGATEEARAIAARVLSESTSRPPLIRQQLTALSLLGRVHQQRSQLDSALALYRESLRIAEEAHDTIGIGTAWINIGVALDLQGDYDAAMEAQFRALRAKEATGDSVGIGRALHNLSALHWRQDRLPEAIELLQRSITIKQDADTLSFAISLNGLGVLLIEAGRYDSAIAVLHESLAMQDRIHRGSNRQIQLTNLGLAFEKAGLLDSAEAYYRTGLQFAAEDEDMEQTVRALYGLGDVLRAEGHLADAKLMLDSSLAVAESIGSLENMKEAHGSLVLLHEQLNDPETALEHYRESTRLGDSLMNVETEARMEELRLRYDTEHKDRENAELRTAQEVSDLRADRNRWIAIGIGVLAIAIVVGAWAMVANSRQRARVREAELEQQALRLQMDPHFLFNALNTVPGLYASGDAALANDHIGHLSKFLRLVLETSRRRTIPLEQEVELVEHYLRISANRRPGAFTWEIKVMPYVNAARVAVPPMLIQPLVENAIEHAFSNDRAGRISVLVDRAGSVLHIEVKDNGIGRAAAASRPSRRNGTSMGIDLVRKRIALFDRRSSAAQSVEVRDERSADGQAMGTTVILRTHVHELDEHAAAGDRG